MYVKMISFIIDYIPNYGGDIFSQKAVLLRKTGSRIVICLIPTCLTYITTYTKYIISSIKQY